MLEAYEYLITTHQIPRLWRKLCETVDNVTMPRTINSSMQVHSDDWSSDRTFLIDIDIAILNQYFPREVFEAFIVGNFSILEETFTQLLHLMYQGTTIEVVDVMMDSTEDVPTVILKDFVVLLRALPFSRLLMGT